MFSRHLAKYRDHAIKAAPFALGVLILGVILLITHPKSGNLPLTASLTGLGTGNNIYISQTAKGNANGVDCNDAYASTFFNTAANWGSNAGQIGPGTTVHLCGVFTFPAGAMGLSVLGSGTSANYITIQFEPGAVLQAPYFGGSEGGSAGCGPAYDCLGGIQVYQQSYVIIDGGTNGIIQNTANGTNLANHQSSNGIYMQGDHLIVRNLTVQDIYMNAGTTSAATDTGGNNTVGILCDGPCTNIAIYNNTVNDSKVGIGGAFSATTGPSGCPAPIGVVGVTTKNLPAPTGNWGLCVYNNNLSDHDWQMGIGAQNGDAINIFSNQWGDIGGLPGWLNWQFPVSAYHQDGLITFPASGKETVYAYDNYSHGDLGQGSPSGHIYCASNDESGPTSGGCTLVAFNNVVVQTGSTQWPNDAENDTPFAIDLSNYSIAGPMTLYNNTVIGGGQSIVAYTTPNSSPQGGPTAYTLVNNIFEPAISGVATGQYITESSGAVVIGAITASNNIYNNGGNNPWTLNNTQYTTISAWQAACNCDTVGTSVGNPYLSSMYEPLLGSPAIGLGANLTSLNIPTLNADMSGTARPASGPWDVGAYQYVGTSTPDTIPPTVSISSPASGAILSGNASPVAASASDNVGVVKVELYVDGNLVGTDMSSPYTFSLDTTALTNGTHVLSAKAYDAAGNIGTSTPVSVTVSNVSQTLSVSLSSSPSSGQAPLATSLTASISGTAQGTITYIFYCNRSDTGTNITNPYDLMVTVPSTQTSYTASNLCAYQTAGTYTPKVIAEQGTASPAQAQASVSVQSPPPPLISSVTVGQVTASSAVITTVLSAPGSIVVKYGQTTGYGQATQSSPYLTTVYVNLTNLFPNTLYDFDVVALPQASGTPVTSQNFSFTTNPLPVTISISNIATVTTQNTATISWTTNIPANSNVLYGTTSLSSSVSSSSLATAHKLILTGLKRTTTYEYQISSTDAHGDTGSSGVSHFTTTKAGK
jgi:hypothetical protein